MSRQYDLTPENLNGPKDNFGVGMAAGALVTLAVVGFILLVYIAAP